MRKLLLITATLLFGMAADNLYACNTIIKPMAWTITTGEFAGQAFTVTGCMDRIPADGLPIIFAFHGGGESEPHFLGFTDLQTLNALVVAPDGNSSHNGTSWINAFPWMKRNPKNDLELPAA